MTTGEEADDVAKVQQPEQRLEQMLASAQQDQRIVEALEHYRRAAALVPPVTYSQPTTRFTAGANQ